VSDVAIINTTVATSPKDYTLPGTQELLLKSAHASIDGSGTAVAYLPALQMLAPDGTVIWPAITLTSVAQGAPADCSWFPGLAGTPISLPLPGQILSAYAGNATVADFTTNSVAFVDSGFPTNTTLTKVSGTSALLIVLLADITPGAAPDVIFCGTFIDGVNLATTGVQISSGGTFVTAPATSHVGLGGSTGSPLTAGAHTVKVRVACNSGTNFTLRCSSSVALSIVEYEA